MSETRNIADLNPAAYNPRQITSDEMEQLRRSIERWGMVDPLVINSNDDIIGGHQRARAAAALGINEVPVVVVDLTADEAKTLNLALNNLGGTWDRSKLDEILATLSDTLVDISGFAATLDEEPDELKPIRFESQGSYVDFDDHRVRAPHPEGAKCSTCKHLTAAYKPK